MFWGPLHTIADEKCQAAQTTFCLFLLDILTLWSEGNENAVKMHMTCSVLGGRGKHWWAHYEKLGTPRNGKVHPNVVYRYLCRYRRLSIPKVSLSIDTVPVQVSSSIDTCEGVTVYRYLWRCHHLSIPVQVSSPIDTYEGVTVYRYMWRCHRLSIPVQVSSSIDTCAGVIVYRYLCRCRRLSIPVQVSSSINTCAGVVVYRYLCKCRRLLSELLLLLS